MNITKSGKRAEHFKGARDHRRHQIAEDYTELIADLIKEQGAVRVCDMAREMGISHVSVLKTLKKLIRDGYLQKNGRQQILLTAEGKELAAFSKKKHEILSQFLRQLGVPEKVLEIDVEGIEHHISPITLEAIESHLKKP